MKPAGISRIFLLLMFSGATRATCIHIWMSGRARRHQGPRAYFSSHHTYAISGLGHGYASAFIASCLRLCVCVCVLASGLCFASMLRPQPCSYRVLSLRFSLLHFSK